MAGGTNGKRWAQAYPELGTGPVPIEPCISPAYFEQEREKLSTRVWLNVGREEEIPQAGDYFVKDIAVCGASILVVREKDGQIRAFHKLYRYHRSFPVDGNPAPTPTPVQTLMHKLGRTFDTMLAASTEELPPYLNPGKIQNWSFDINVIFPNFFVDVLDGMYFTYNFWPLAVDRTLWEFRQYYPPAETAAQRFIQEYSKCLFRDALLEDLSTLEHTQAALATRGKTHFLLQDNEVCICAGSCGVVR